MIGHDYYIPVLGKLVDHLAEHSRQRLLGGDGFFCDILPMLQQHFKEEGDCFDKCVRAEIDPCCCRPFQSIQPCEEPIEVCDPDENIIEL